MGEVRSKERQRKERDLHNIPVIKQLIEKDGMDKVWAVLEDITGEVLRSYPNAFARGSNRDELMSLFKFVKYGRSKLPYYLTSYSQLKDLYPDWVDWIDNFGQLTSFPKGTFLPITSTHPAYIIFNNLAHFFSEKLSLSERVEIMADQDELKDIPQDILCHMVYMHEHTPTDIKLGSNVIDLRPLGNTETLEEPDMVNSPAHYQLAGIEVIDIIRAATESLSGPEGYELGNALKYLLRYPHKDNALQDLQKARKHVDWLIKRYESGGEI